MSPLDSRFTLRARQQGAVGLMAALTLALALLCMLVVIDSGRLYLEKRSLQRVADMAALEAASRKGTCGTGLSAATYATESGVRNGFTIGDDGRALTVNCGLLAVDAIGKRVFTADSTQLQAIKVVATHAVPRSIAAGIGAMFDSTPTPVNITLSATAVATATPPLAQLTIKSALTVVDSTTGTLLNAVVGGMLGGSLNLSVASWQGLVDSQLNLLSYLNRLKTDLNLSAVGYTEVLSKTVSIGQLIDSTIHVLDPSGTLSSSTAIAGLNAIKTAAGSTTVVLGDLLKIQGSSDIAALDTRIGVFDLIQGVVQVSNSKSGVMASVPINLPGLAQVNAQVKVIQPPQMSAIGDPSKVDPSNPLGTHQIYVRTAQTRALVSITLPVLGTISPLIDAATDLLSPITPIVNSALSLNLANTLTAAACLLGAGCQVTDFKWLGSASTGPKIDLSFDIGSAQTYVTGYSCASNASKSLTVRTDTSLINLKIGSISAADAFPSSTTPGAVVPKPLAVLDIGTKTCHSFVGLGSTCGARTPFAGGGLGVTVDSGLAPTAPGTSSSLLFASPLLPEVNSAPQFSSPLPVLPSNLLKNTVTGVQVQAYKPVAGNALGSVISGAGSVLGGITTALDTVIGNTLTPLLTSLVDPLFKALGITLAPAIVGANLSCNFGQATLVI